MWRAIFIAAGVMAMIIGIETLVIESADIYTSRGSTAREFLDPSTVDGQSTITFEPPEWFPWMVLSTGAITVIYTFSLPKRFKAS
ncbi:hypothetical protein SV7mr_21480 [Stieleria bergensis]|uniref:Uncharacterized protein n=1 Tax=Stieleria bergensis TaxID=2528025 RepID=A0A517SU34_9BACT|nr:MAG: hypothetical protein CBB71_00115 [Rhodopirellula sp. TMED11]QDT59639.1 hypothetical protein SV7mr_21480 [Planctomycetes bacterium SV_7m_r]